MRCQSAFGKEISTWLDCTVEKNTHQGLNREESKSRWKRWTIDWIIHVPPEFRNFESTENCPRGLEAFTRAKHCAGLEIPTDIVANSVRLATRSFQAFAKLATSSKFTTKFKTYQIATKTWELANRFLVLIRRKRPDFIFNFESCCGWNSLTKTLQLYQNSSRPRGREAATHKVGDSLVFVGSTPRTIRHRHFGELVSFHGFGSATEFAENVLQSSKEEQREILKQFYVKQNSALASLDVFMRPDAQGGSNGGGNRERRKRGKNKKGVASNWKRHRRRGPAPVHSGRAEAGATSPSSDSRDSGFRPVRGAVGRRRRASGLDSVSGFGFGTADGGVDKLDEPPSGSASNDSDIPDLDATKALDMGLHEVAHDKSTVESKTGAESGLDSAESIVEDFEFRARLRSLNRIENSTAQSCSADVAEAFSCSHFSCNTNSRHKSYAASLLQEFIPTGNEPCAELTGNRDEIFGDARLSHTAHVDLSTQTREEIAQATREVCVAGTRGPIKHEDIVGRKCAALRTSILDELI